MAHPVVGQSNILTTGWKASGTLQSKSWVKSGTKCVLLAMIHYIQSMETSPQKYDWAVSTIKHIFKVLGDMDLDASIEENLTWREFNTG